MIQLLICKEVKHGLPFIERKVKRYQRYDSGGVVIQLPEIGWHGSSGTGIKKGM